MPWVTWRSEADAQKADDSAAADSVGIYARRSELAEHRDHGAEAADLDQREDR